MASRQHQQTDGSGALQGTDDAEETEIQPCGDFVKFILQAESDDTQTHDCKDYIEWLRRFKNDYPVGE
jgi:hypothetical protein